MDDGSKTLVVVGGGKCKGRRCWINQRECASFWKEGKKERSKSRTIIPQTCHQSTPTGNTCSPKKERLKTSRGSSDFLWGAVMIHVWMVFLEPRAASGLLRRIYISASKLRCRCEFCGIRFSSTVALPCSS